MGEIGQIDNALTASGMIIGSAGTVGSVILGFLVNPAAGLLVAGTTIAASVGIGAVSYNVSQVKTLLNSTLSKFQRFIYFNDKQMLEHKAEIMRDIVEFSAIMSYHSTLFSSRWSNIKPYLKNIWSIYKEIKTWFYDKKTGFWKDKTTSGYIPSIKISNENLQVKNSKPTHILHNNYLGGYAGAPGLSKTIGVLTERVVPKMVLRAIEHCLNAEDLESALKTHIDKLKDKNKGDK